MLKRQKLSTLRVFVLCLILSYAPGIIGFISMGNEIESAWYQSVKPSITPPDWVFPIVWNILFFLIALSLFFAWRASAIRGDRIRIGAIYCVNLVANSLWTWLYFGLHRPGLALLDLGIIWFSIVNIMYLTWDIDRKAVWLMVPYLIWVSFAGVLNFLSLR